MGIRWSIRLLVLAPLVIVVFWASVSLADGQADLATAEKAYQAKDYDTALKFYGKAIKAGGLSKKQMIDAHFGRANILYHIKRNWNSAISDLNAMLRLDLNQKSALFTRSRVYKKRAYYTFSEEDLKRSIQDLIRLHRITPPQHFNSPIGTAEYCQFGCEYGLITCRKACAADAKKGVCGQLGACRRRSMKSCSSICLISAGHCGSWCSNHRHKYKGK